MLAAILVLGSLSAFDTPARSAIPPTMVSLGDIQRAVAFVSTAYPAARVVGPAAAGILLGMDNPTLVFWLSAICYGALIPALPLAKPLKKAIAAHDTVKSPGFREGIAYLRKHFDLQIALYFSLVSGIFGWLPQTFMPASAVDLVGTDSVGLGWLMAACAAGSLLSNAAIALGWLRFKRLADLLWPTLVLAVTMAAIGHSHDLTLSLALALLVGIGLSASYTGGVSMLQQLVDERYRGRVLGIQYAAISLAPAPYLGLGLVARSAGLSMTFLLISLITAFLALILYIPAMRYHRTTQSEG
jgi:MFS family permease